MKNSTANNQAAATVKSSNRPAPALRLKVSHVKPSTQRRPCTSFIY